MSTYLQFVVLGLAAGAVYAALADGLIAVYRATGILNFAQGAMAAWGVYVYAWLRGEGVLMLPIGKIPLAGVGVVPALAIGVLSSMAVGLLAHLLVFRPLRTAPPLAQVVASVGLMITMQALVLLRFGGGAVTVDAILPSSSVTVLGAQLSVTSLYLAGIAIAATVALWAYFKFTRYGMATRAAAEDERALRLMGYSPDRLAAIVWVGTTALCGFVLTLASPSVGLNPTLYAVAVVPGLAVAVLGRLTSVGLACMAGLALGAFQALVTYLTTKSWWPGWAVTGVEDAVPFLVILVALYAFGGRMPSRGSLGETRLPAIRVPQLKPPVVALTVGGGALLLLLTSGGYRFGAVTSIMIMLLALSCVLLTGYLGQISLAQMAFAGTAGLALSKATVNLGIPFPLSIFAAAAVAALLGVVVGLPALRIRGAQLAVVTLALAVAVESFVFNNPALTPLTGNEIKDPSLLGLNLAVRSGSDLTRLSFCFAVLGIAAVVVLLTAWLMRGQTGRAFLAVRSNERAAASVGIDVARCKLIGFALSAFIAGIAGTLIGYSRGQMSPDSFTLMTGLSLVSTWALTRQFGRSAMMG